MSNLFAPRYVLAVRDLQVAASFYQEVLGFAVVGEFPGWVFVQRDQVMVMLGECPEEVPAADTGNHSYHAYVEVQDARGLCEEFAARDVQFIKPLQDEPWGMREFGLVTPEGHRMMFGQDLAKG